MKDKVSIYDHLTGETIVREMTDEEQAQRDSEVAAYLASKEAEVQKAAEAQVQHQALLERLGITAEEAKLLLG